MKILLDTNFIITALRLKIQLFEQIEDLFPSCKIIIPNQVIYELEKITEGKEKKIIDRERGQLAIDLIKKKSVHNLEFTTDSADAGIIRYTIKNPKTIIATLDRELKTKIREKNPDVKFLTIRAKNKIEVQ